MDKKIIIFLVFAVLGLFLLKSGITGFSIISQTCCFPPHCDEENTCTGDVEMPSPGRVYVGAIGSLLIVFLSLYIIKHLQKH